MIKTADGEKIYPEEIEDKLLDIDEVTSAMVCAVHGHLTAVLFLKENSEENRKKVTEAIDRINSGAANYCKIADIRFREKPFPMTTSLKIRRAEVMKEIEDCGNCKKTAAPPETEMQRIIREYVIQLLPDAEEISIDDNLFDFGLDSLYALHLAMRIGCDPSVIYVCRTIRRLSEYDSGGGADRPISDGIKTAGINSFIQQSGTESVKENDTALFTGASGYLGIHLLNEWLKSNRKAVCLVRSTDSFNKAREYYGIPESCDRVEFVTGDITKDRFGLTTEEYENLCGRIDAVFHAAALVSHLGEFERSYSVNVEGTQRVIDFCSDSGARLYHISSYAVSGFNTDKPLTEDVLDIGQEITQNPYIQTKYQAEELVLQARGKGVPSTIFRIGNLTERASDGKFQINASESGLAAQLRAFRRAGIYPRSMAGIMYDSTAVDEAAKAVMLLAEQFTTGYIWHIMNPDVHSIEALTGAVMSEDSEFVHKLEENRTDRDTAILSLYYRMNQEGFNTRFEMSRTLEKLEDIGFRWSDNN